MWVVVTDEATMGYSVDYYIRGIYDSKEQAQKRVTYLTKHLRAPIKVLEINANKHVRQYVGGYCE